MMVLNEFKHATIITSFSPPVKYFADRSKAVLLLWVICVFVSRVSHAFASVHCCLVVTCWERADLLALVGFCLFWFFTSTQQSFSYAGQVFLGARINVLAQGHNTVTTKRLEPAAPRSRVKPSTTKPLRSRSCWWCYCSFVIFPCGILGQVWYLIVSFPDFCLLCLLV